MADVQLLEHALDFAHHIADHDPTAALDALRPHLDGIEAPAFRSDALGKGLTEWATANGVVGRIERAIVDAALLAADLFIFADPPNPDQATEAVEQALQAIPTNEALVRRAMSLAADSGNRSTADQHYQALATQLGRDDIEPEPETVALRQRIMKPRHRIG